MKRLEVEFTRNKNVVMAEIKKQTGIELGDGIFFKHDGYYLSSVVRPEVCSEGLYVRGTKGSWDNSVGCCEFESEREAIKYIEGITNTIIEFNKDNGFSKKDLKVGYLVVYRNCKVRMVMVDSSTKDMVLVDKNFGRGNKLNHYLDNLEDKDNDNNLDIVQVYGLPEFPEDVDISQRELSLETKYRPLLWSE